jgi:hypothetical protein
MHIPVAVHDQRCLDVSMETQLTWMARTVLKTSGGTCMNYSKSAASASLAILAALSLAACSQGLVASWKAPNAAPFEMNG